MEMKATQKHEATQEAITRGHPLRGPNQGHENDGEKRQRFLKVVWEPVSDSDAQDRLSRAFEMIFAGEFGYPQPIFDNKTSRVHELDERSLTP
jgi:hypothetical protein